MTIHVTITSYRNVEVLTSLTISYQCVLCRDFYCEENRHFVLFCRLRYVCVVPPISSADINTYLRPVKASRRTLKREFKNYGLVAKETGLLQRWRIQIWFYY